MASLAEPQRLDARRNRQAVLDSAVELLSEGPEASMQQIAEASGLGRTTVYRHFPNREDLLRALFEQLVQEAEGITGRVIEEGGSAEQILRRLAPEMIAVGLRYRFLNAYRELGRAAMQEGKEDEGDPVGLYLVAAQGRGDIRPDVPIQWMMSLVQALSVAAMDDLYAGHFDQATVSGLLGDSLVAALIPD